MSYNERTYSEFVVFVCWAYESAAVQKRLNQLSAVWGCGNKESGIRVMGPDPAPPTERGTLSEDVPASCLYVPAIKREEAMRYLLNYFRHLLLTCIACTVIDADYC